MDDDDVGARLARTTAAYEQLVQVDRWKDALFGAAAHDLRTQLAIARMAAETILHVHEETPERVPALAQQVVRYVSRLGDLLDDLLEFDRLTRGVVEAVRAPSDVHALVADVVAGLDGAAQRVEVRGGPTTADVDAPRVQRLVHHLLTNALSHTIDGTPVSVDVGQDGDAVLVVVRDRGTGVPDAIRDVVTDPFVSAPAHDGDRGGPGLGLRLVELLAELHGGSLVLEHPDDGGLRAIVRLPRGRHPAS